MSKHTRKGTITLTALAAIALVGCVGDLDPVDPNRPDDSSDDPSTPASPDAGTPTGDTPTACTSAQTPRIVGATEQGGFGTEEGSQIVVYDASYQDGARTNALQISLWSGYGAFTNGIQAGTYPVGAGDDCDVCVALFGGDDGTSYEQVYVGTSGSLTISAVSAADNGRFSGTLSVELQEFDETTGQAVAGGCSASVTNHAFDVTLQALTL
jgi:hypothetical protein